MVNSPARHPRRRHPPAAFLLPGYAHPPRREKPHHGLPALTTGPRGTAAGCATAARPAALGTGSPQDVGTGCPGASRTQNMPVIAPRSVLGGFRAPGGVLVPGQAADAANSLSRGMSFGQVLRFDARRLLLALEGHLEEQGAVFHRISVPLPERSPLARDRRAGV